MLNSKLCHTPTKIVESFQKLFDGVQLVDGTVLKAAVADIRGDWKGLVEARLSTKSNITSQNNEPFGTPRYWITICQKIHEDHVTVALFNKHPTLLLGVLC